MRSAAASPGVFFTLQELKAVFPRLKRDEPLLGREEREALLKMEKFLYEYLSIDEIEEMGGAEGPGR